MLSLEQVERVCRAPVWAWREEDGWGLVAVLKTGQKFRYSAEEVQRVLVQPAPAAAPGAVTKMATPAAELLASPVTTAGKPAAKKRKV
jgi:hypothetical protein